MSRAPRLLPLIAVAAGGVLAVKAVSGMESAPALLKGGAAHAEEAAGAKAAAPAAAVAVAAAAAPAVAKPPVAPVCAPSATELAKQAGLSPAELRVLQSLQSRRGELDDREKNLDTQLALMAAAEAKLDAKLKSLEALKGQINGLLAQSDQRQEAEIVRLVKVYESMKPKDAAAVLSQLDDKVRLPVAAKMKERSLAAVLAAMPAAEARKLTEKLADRYAAPEAAAAKLADAKPAEPAAAKPAAKG